MAQLKDSEQMLSFLKDLSKFSETFSTFKNEPKKQDSTQKKPPPKEEAKKESPQSPTTGIADDFIQKILDSYLQTHSSNDWKPTVDGNIHPRNVCVFF